MEQTSGPTGLQIVRELVRECLPGAKISSGIESINIGSKKPALFSIQMEDNYATFLLDEGVLLRRTNTKRVFDLRIPNSTAELKEYLSRLFDAPPETT